MASLADAIIEAIEYEISTGADLSLDDIQTACSSAAEHFEGLQQSAIARAEGDGFTKEDEE